MILRGCPTPDSATGLQPRRECSRSRQPRRTRRSWRPKLDCVSTISGQAIGLRTPMQKRSSGEAHGKTLPAVHNRRLQLEVDSASRGKTSWPRLEDRQSGDYLENRCHRLPHVAPWIKIYFFPVFTRVNVMATAWGLWVWKQPQTARVSALSPTSLEPCYVRIAR